MSQQFLAYYRRRDRQAILIQHELARQLEQEIVGLEEEYIAFGTITWTRRKLDLLGHRSGCVGCSTCCGSCDGSGESGGCAAAEELIPDLADVVIKTAPWVSAGLVLC